MSCLSINSKFRLEMLPLAFAADSGRLLAHFLQQADARELVNVSRAVAGLLLTQGLLEHFSATYDFRIKLNIHSTHPEYSEVELWDPNVKLIFSIFSACLITSLRIGVTNDSACVTHLLNTSSSLKQSSPPNSTQSVINAVATSFSSFAF